MGLFQLRQQGQGALVVNRPASVGLTWRVVRDNSRVERDSSSCCISLGGHGDRDPELMGGLGETLALHHLDEGAHGGYLIHIPLG